MLSFTYLGNQSSIHVRQSGPLQGEFRVLGAKNAALVIMVSLILVRGKSTLYNVPASADIFSTITLLQALGARVLFSPFDHRLDVDTSAITHWSVSPAIMQKTRASILAMGPLIARFGKADLAYPGGDAIGARPIDLHLKNFIKMGVAIKEGEHILEARVADSLKGCRLRLDYPSVGATENLLLAAVVAQGTTCVVNAALEPEVLDLIAVLNKMGAKIEIQCPNTLLIEGVAANDLQPIEHEIIPDRLEAGSVLTAVAVTGGTVCVPNIAADILDLFLLKLEEMGHEVIIGPFNKGITVKATSHPQAVSFKTGPYPSFATDLQPLLMVAQTVASGVSVIEETVHENRLQHVHSLRAMGAQITIDHHKAIVHGVRSLHGTHVEATDIRASCALVIAGLIAKGVTVVDGAEHWMRGYERLEERLRPLGAHIAISKSNNNQEVQALVLSSMSS